MAFYHYHKPFELECGALLPEIEIAYETWGTLNERADNVIWVTHALTANARVDQWWPQMVGAGCLMDPIHSFVVCANIIGSCYGSTGPLTLHPETGNRWFREFPLVTPRDMARVHQLLCDALGIRQVQLLLGASIGGFQALEWAVLSPNLIRNLVVLASSAKASPWVVALNESQRMAIESDGSFFRDIDEGGKAGLEAARSIALLSYRNAKTYNHTQTSMEERLDRHPAASYQRYQGVKLSRRFNAYSYYVLTRAMDTHDLGRNRGGVARALNDIRARTLCVGISSDILFPIDEQKFIARCIPGAKYHQIDSLYGHDGFLIETLSISKLINEFLQDERKKN